MMSFWTDIRDAAEAGLADVANVVTGLPVSGFINPLLSKGAQKIQSSMLGEIGQIGSSIYGATGGTIPGINDAGSFAAGAPNYGKQALDYLGIGGGGAAPAGGGAAMSPDYVAPGSTVGGEMGTGGGITSTPLGDDGMEMTQTKMDAAVAPAQTTGQVSVPPQATPTPSSTPGASGVEKGLSQQSMDWVKNNKLQAMQLSLGAANIIGQKPAELNPALMNMAAPYKKLSEDLMSKYQSGQLTPGDAYSIAQNTQNQKQAIKQYYQNAGLADSSMEQSALDQVDAQAEAMREKALTGMLSNAVNLAGVSDPLMKAAIQDQTAQDAAATKAQQDFAQQLMRVAAGDQGTQAPPKGTQAPQ